MGVNRVTLLVYRIFETPRDLCSCMILVLSHQSKRMSVFSLHLQHLLISANNFRLTLGLRILLALAPGHEICCVLL